MRTACAWQDYTLLDATDGYRLENWGKVILQRPDPQVIWKLERDSALWNKADAIYNRSQKGGGEWNYKHKIPNEWSIQYEHDNERLKFIISPTAFKHTGIFPEQAVNWDMYKTLIKKADRPVKVLNLFGYTGGATLACAQAGASVTHVDASKGMVSWARKNATLNGLEDRPIRWIVEDCSKFVAREIRRGKTYDAIIMDPPSYGRGPNGEIWHLEDSIYDLLKLTEQVLAKDALFFTLNSYTAGLASGVMHYMLHALLTPTRGGKVLSDEIGLPVLSTQGVLPCGATSFWCLE